MISDRSLVEIIWALAALSFPVCTLIFLIIFRRDIRRLFQRIGENKSGKEKSHDEPQYKDIQIVKGDDIDRKNIDKTTVNYHSKEVDDFAAEVCSNKITNKYFIMLDNISNDFATMIIPNGEIKKDLEMNLFNNCEIKTISELLTNQLITNEQFKSYNRYIKTDADKFLTNYDSITIIPKTGRSSQHSEPYYLKSYRNLLNKPDTWPSRMLNIIEKEQPISKDKLHDIIVKRYHYAASDTNGSFHASLRILLVDGHITKGVGGKFNRKY